uniref:1-aminocyclopropane-1-carboxylate synthase-like protein 1 n=1 Tax=Sphenodon punctatus TaxID=8508 RepID=A0A8D0G307_SPHPU
MDLWWKLLDQKLFISPGKAFFCYEPGWFRLVFSNSLDKICLCIERLQQILHTESAEQVPNKSSPIENEYASSENKPSANHINTSGDEVSEAYSHLKKIVVY